MLSLPVSPYSSPPTSAHASPSREPGEIEPATEPEKVPSSNEAKVEVSKLMKMLKFLLGIGLQSFDQVIDWLESISADYRDVVNRIKSAEERGEVHHSPSSDEPSSPRETVSTDESGTGPITTVAEVHPHQENEGKESTKPHPLSLPTSTGSPPPISPSSPINTILTRVHPTAKEEEEADDVQTQLEAATKHYTERPKRLLLAIYYWALSHFDYVVFFFVILAIMRGGSVVSLGYAAILFVWGLLSIPWPTKRFWVTLMFYTMSVLVILYIFLCVVMTMTSINSDLPPTVVNTAFLWLLGVPADSTYIEVAIFSLLLLMSIIFHRGLLRVSDREREEGGGG